MKKDSRSAKAERFHQILTLLEKEKYLTVEELSRMLYVSRSTLRRDLAAMSLSGYLVRVRGGAESLAPWDAGESIVHTQGIAFTAAEERIAEKAVELIHDGDAVFLDASRLTLCMAPGLSRKKNLTVVTGSLLLVQSLPKGLHRVVACGGNITARNFSVSGGLASRTAARFNYHTAFLCGAGISEHSVTCRTEETAELLSTAASRAKSCVLLCPAEKLNDTSLINAVPLSRISAVITDAKTGLEHLNVPVWRV